MGWHKGETAYWDIEYFEPYKLGDLQYRGNGLWTWADEGAKYYNYNGFFALPIFVLKDENDLKNFVLKPLETLFNAENAGDVAAEAFAGVPVLTPAAG